MIISMKSNISLKQRCNYLEVYKLKDSWVCLYKLSIDIYVETYTETQIDRYIKKDRLIDVYRKIYRLLERKM